jgi:uncharacterized membrane protein
MDSSEENKDPIDDKGPFWMSPDRIVALTDGVFAITMTILVLELRAEVLWHSEHWIEFYAYGLGFYSLAVFWTLHHYIFHFVKRSTGGLIWINVVFLAASSLVPFWTVVINSPEVATFPEYIAFYYGLYMIIVMLTLIGLWQFVTKNNYLVGREFNPKIVPAFNKVVIVGIIILIISSVGSILPGHLANLGYLLFLAGAWFLVATVYGPHKIFK